MNITNTNIEENIESIFGNNSEKLYEIFQYYKSKPISFSPQAKYDERDRYLFHVMTNYNGILSYRRVAIGYNQNIDTFTHKGFLYYGDPMNQNTGW